MGLTVFLTKADMLMFRLVDGKHFICTNWQSYLFCHLHRTFKFTVRKPTGNLLWDVERFDTTDPWTLFPSRCLRCTFLTFDSRIICLKT